MATQLPSKIGKYDLVGLIGRGDNGVVFDAVDPDLNRRVAIKMIARTFLEDGEDWKRFFAHAESLSRLQHANIANVYDAGLEESYPYLVMEYVDGESLESALKVTRSFTLFEKLSIIAQVCEGLAYAHGHGKTHDDIKPGNIILCRDGSVKLTDVGISSAVHETVIRNDELKGSLNYMAPEHAGTGLPDDRADLFSTGVVLYQLLSNHLPFEADNPEGIIRNILHEPAPPLSTFATHCPPEIEASLQSVLDRAMAKNPADRYKGAEDLASDLRRLLDQLDERSGIPHGNEGGVALLEDAEPSQPFQSSTPLVNLWVQAERALAEERFEEAREHAEKALALAPEDLDLQQLRETIRVEAARTEKLRTILRTALAEQADGNLDAARKAAEKAIKIAPNHAEAKALHQLISLQALELARQRQIENSLQSARQEISCRNFGGAIEILRRAEELDPNAPGVQSLIQLAALGQQQETRRQEMECRQQAVEKQKSAGLEHAAEAIAREDYDRAIQILEELAKDFGEDAEIHKLLDRARSERATAVHLVLRKVEEEPDLNQSKIILRAALEKLPTEKRLEEKLVQVDHFEQIVAKAIVDAAKLEDAGQYDQALAKWEMVRVLHPRHPDLKEAPKRIRNLQERSRGVSKQAWIDRIEKALSNSDYSDIRALVDESLMQFAWDSELMDLQERAEAGIRHRANAQKLVAKAHALLTKQKWEAAGERFVRAFHAAPGDALVRNQVVEGLSLASRDAMQKDRKAGALILEELARLEGVAADPHDATEPQKTEHDESGAEGYLLSREPGMLLAGEAEVAPVSSEMKAGVASGASAGLHPEQRSRQNILIPSGVLMENVRFSVVAPSSLERGGEGEIEFWVNVGEKSEAELERARGMAQPGHAGALHPETAFAGGARLSVRLRSGGLTCLENHKWFVWTGALGYCSFRVTVPLEVPEGDLVCVSSIRLNGCQIAKLTFLLNIGSKLLAGQAIPCQTVMHRKAFASYETADRDEVLARVKEMESAYKTLKVYVDAPNLRSVTYWEPDLHARIDGADVFYLFWSRNAAASDWVAREWRWALRSKGLDFIDPVPLQSSESTPPPAALAAKQFDDPLFEVAAGHAIESHWL